MVNPCGLLLAHLAFSAVVLPPPEPKFNGIVAPNVADSVPDAPKPTLAPKGAPNIIVILLDDAGFGATAAFGGPVRTPEIDRLAAEGLRYNHFHVSAQCSPTRAALLTGRNDHVAGFGAVGYGGYPGYTGVLKKSTALFADVLRRNGYSTSAFGKWHNTPSWEVTPVGPFDRWPTSVGFEYFYGFLNGRDSQWEPTLYRNTTAVEPPAKPNGGYHLTTDLTDDAIRWIQTHESLAPERPYFLYFATGATHEPHHVAREWIEKYKGRFDEGWDKLREQIFERQRRLGVIPASAELTPRPDELPAWDSFSADERALLARQMEVYAGFLEQTDFEVGRLLKAAKQGPGGENTLIFYIPGDNGASSEGGLSGGDDFHTRKETPETVSYRLAHMDELGGPDHENHYASGWAWALCSPFKWQKLVASHFGGTRDPLIVSWPARIKDHGGLRTQFAHVNDLAATIYDVTGIPFPDSVDGVAQLPLNGVSFAETFTRADAPSRHHIQIFEQWANRAIYQDGWIAAARHTVPWNQGAYAKNHNYAADPWELYNVDADFSEAHDLAAQYPDRLKAMQALFDAEAAKNSIFPIGGATKATDMPVFTGDKTNFVYYPGLPRMHPSAAPKFGGSHRISAVVVLPESGASGVIISNGSRTGGFVLYVKNGHLVYENNTTLARDVITSKIPLAPGRSEIAFEFVKEGAPASGTGRLFINGSLVGEAKLPRLGWETTGGLKMPGSFGIGQSFGSPVSSQYESPFAFSGVLEHVRVELR